MSRRQLADVGATISSFTHGLLISALLVSSVVLLPGGPAIAGGCTYTGGDVLAHDDGSTLSVIGNRGDVWVNNLSSAPPHGIVRAMVTSTNIFTNYIEFGWSWGPDYTPSGRIWFIGWIVNGAASYYNGNGVAINQYDHYSLRDSNRDTVWNFKFNGSDVGPNVNHNFTNSNAVTLDEVETDCDTGWGLFTNLERCISQGCNDWWDWHTLKCRYDDNDEYHLDKTNDTQHYVRTGQSANGCAGATGGG